MTQLARHFQAIHAGQREIEHDHVEIVHHGQMQAGHAVAREIDHVAAVFKIIADVGRDIAVVFDHQYAHASLLRSRHTGRLWLQA